MHIVGFLLAILIGVSLGLLGGGGSILAVPILVYAVGMAAKPAIAVSLLVVGATSVVGAMRHWKSGNVDFRTALVFGAVSMAGSYAGGRLAAQLTDTFQLTLFAVVMLAASVSMFRPARPESEQGTPARLPLVVAAAVLVGLLTGVVGVGGGFLIVPALVLFGGLAMKQAVGTSLLVIAVNSASGFLAYAGDVRVDWTFTLLFTGLAVAGVFAGAALARYVSARQLRRGFAVFLIAVATFVLAQSAIVTRAHADQSPKPAHPSVVTSPGATPGTMTCGCPTEPGGLWNADDITVTARVLRNGSVVAELALPYAGQTSTYEAAVAALEPGTYLVEVLASDTRASNFGRTVARLVVRAAS